MYKSSVAVNHSALIHSAETFNDAFVANIVHGKGKSVPVDTNSHSAELHVDFVTVLVFPLPDFLKEFFTAIIVSSLLFFFPERVLDNHLS